MTDLQTTLQLRFETCRTAADNWCGQPGHSQARLAEQVGVGETEICKFINAEPHYVPTPKRPGKIRLLEKVEAVCLAPGVLDVDEPPTEEDTALLATDEGATHLEHRGQVKRILQLDAPMLLERARTLKQRALDDRSEYRLQKVSNVAFLLFHRTDVAAGLITVELLEQTLVRNEELYEAVTPETNRDYWAVAAMHFSGAARFHIGRHLVCSGEEWGGDVLESGLDRVAESMRTPPNDAVKHQKRWHNVIEMIQKYVELDERIAKHWARRFRAIGGESGGAAFKAAKDAARQCCPEACALLDGDVGSHVPTISTIAKAVLVAVVALWSGTLFAAHGELGRMSVPQPHEIAVTLDAHGELGAPSKLR